jgi:hypothetical protein
MKQAICGKCGAKFPGVIPDDAEQMTCFTCDMAAEAEPRDVKYTRAQWFSLPIELRRRWWTETNFGHRPPSPELQHAVAEALQ